MKSRPILAVDLGATKIACALGMPKPATGNGLNSHAEPAAIELLGCGLAPYPLGERAWPCDPALMADVLEQALAEIKQAPLPDSAIVSLSHPELTHARVIAHIDIADEPVTIRSREVARVKSQALSQALALDRDVLELETLGYAGNGFDEVKDPRGLPATRLSGRFQLVTVPLAVKRAIFHGFELAGLEVDRLVYGLTAMARRWGRSDARRTLLIDIGGWSTELAVADDGCLIRTMSIGWGGLAIADVLARSRHLTFEQALTISLGGFSSPDDGVREAVNAQAEPLRAGIREILEGLASPNQAVVTGRGALIDGMVEWIAQLAGIPASLGRSPDLGAFGELNRQVALSSAVSVLEFACGPGLAASSRSAGLANRVLDRTRQLLIDYF